MASQLDIKKLKLQLMQISLGRAQTEFRIEEYMDNAKRLEPTLDEQIKQEKELAAKIAELEKEIKE